MNFKKCIYFVEGNCEKQLKKTDVLLKISSVFKIMSGRSK